MSSYF